MNSDQLRQFKAIYDYGNLTRAAENLYISQPALSVSLNKLEAELNTSLFVRKGRVMELTADGEKLLEYTNVILTTLDEAAAYFRQNRETDVVVLNRIGGIGGSMLVSGYYNVMERELKMHMIPNSDVPKMFTGDHMPLLIADGKCPSLSRNVRKKFLYHQRLMISVLKTDPLSERESISFEELAGYDLAGKNGKMGFNDWVRDIEKENQVSIRMVTHMDYLFFVTEGAFLTKPFLMSSFGESVSGYSPSFSNRKSIPVTGKGTERDIYLYFDVRDQDYLEGLIDLIQRNAVKISTADEAWRAKLP